ncbi:MAG: antibiotic biosynthesis monooxygenase [Thermomicrobiales bacterium]|nr:antibiotic biosynthesis monooxygenase [Thermomicrobiales bacterium]
MVIVAGVFTVDPEQREAFLAGRKALMEHSRAETGCLEYTFSADPLDPGRVVLFERWASQADLDAHLAGLSAPSAPAASGPEPATSWIVIYDVAGERPLVR